ncbi:MAG: hypothetical protein CVV42_19305 [Candidatus Riflebacteria bacterium HGW-Riflebacteria-2]|jgi:hypothetical protein|nr:MAG: hypothetical protein CVV42_19305 [Candidatus Riflebacteria bacterium HGW-Riflebacteria-2]
MRKIFLVLVFLCSAACLSAAEPDLTLLGADSPLPVEQQQGYAGHSTQYKLTPDGKISIVIEQPESEEQLPPQPADAPQVTEPEPAGPTPPVDPVIAWEFHYGTPSGKQTITRSKEEFGEAYRDSDAFTVPSDWTYWSSNPVRESGARE